MTTSADTTTMQRIAMTLELLEANVPIQRRLLHAGDTLYRAGDRFERLHVLRSGSCKIVDRSADGREQVVALPLRGDWLGFDGIADGRYRCDAIATDVGEIWAMRYDDLLRACGSHHELIAVLHGAMSQEIGRDRQVLMSLCSLPADARVADFLRSWADALAERGLRTDRIVLGLTRAEIGNFLGMNLETVSRALSRLARGDVIRFIEKQRRAIEIPEVEALKVFIQRSLLSLPPARGAECSRPST